MEKSRRASPALFLCPAGDLRQLQNRTRRGDTDSRLLRKSLLCGHFRRRTGWAGRMRKERPKAFVYRCAPPQVERNCHRALTALTNGRDSLKAHPGRKQTGGKMLPFVPPCSILSGTQPLSGRWRMIPSFCPVSCSRCGRSFIAPGPRGHICPQCQKERRMNREKSPVRIPRTTRTAESRIQTNVEARSSRAVEPVRVPVQLVESRWQDMLDQGMLATCPRMHLTASRLPCGERSECFGLSRCQFVPQNMNRPLRRTFF